MKKTILSIAILASSILTFAGTNTAGQDNKATDTEQTAPAKNANGDKKAKGEKRAGKHARANRENRLFSGITLTADQMAKLDELKARNKEAREAKKKEGRERSEGFSAEQKKQFRADREASRRNYLAEVKKILTPEQYAIFLENNFVFNDNGHKAHRAHKAHKAHKADGRKHDRKSMASGDKGSHKNDKRRS